METGEPKHVGGVEMVDPKNGRGLKINESKRGGRCAAEGCT